MAKIKSNKWIKSYQKDDLVVEIHIIHKGKRHMGYYFIKKEERNRDGVIKSANRLTTSIQVSLNKLLELNK